MASELTNTPATTTLDLTGLPEPVVQQVKQFVQQARRQQAEGTPGLPKPAEGQPGVIGTCAHPGIKTSTLEEFEEARHETWANFPREFPDPSK